MRDLPCGDGCSGGRPINSVDPRGRGNISQLLKEGLKLDVPHQWPIGFILKDRF